MQKVSKLQSQLLNRPQYRGTICFNRMDWVRHWKLFRRNNPATVTMNSAVTETSTWEHQYELTVISSQGTATGNQTWYDAGTATTSWISHKSLGMLKIAAFQLELNMYLLDGVVLLQVLV